MQDTLYSDALCLANDLTNLSVSGTPIVQVLASGVFNETIEANDKGRVARIELEFIIKTSAF